MSSTLRLKKSLPERELLREPLDMLFDDEALFNITAWQEFIRSTGDGQHHLHRHRHYSQNRMQLPMSAH